MKNVHRFDGDTDFTTEYNGSGYEEPWVSVADNIETVTGLECVMYNDPYTLELLARRPVGKFCIINAEWVNNLPSHIDYIYIWDSLYSGSIEVGNVSTLKAAMPSASGDMMGTLSDEFIESNEEQNILTFQVYDDYDFYYLYNGYDSQFDSISNIETNTVSNLAYSKRVDNYEHHMSFDLADYDSTNMRLPVTLDFEVSIDSGMAAKGNTSNDGIKILVTFQDGQTERKCFAYYPSNDNIKLSDYDTNGDLINFSSRCGLYPWFEMYNDQWYLCFSSGSIS